MDNKRLISFVIPCYRSEKTIKMVTDEIISVVGQKCEYDYEIIAVNDCSPDNVLHELISIAGGNDKIKVVDFMQNCGKEAAVLAGLGYASGDIAIITDDDYQCPINELWRLIEPIESGEYDVSTAKYKVKKESFFKRFCSDINMKCAQIMLNQPKGLRFENLTAISRPVYSKMLEYKNPYPMMDGLILRITKRIATVPMEERSRGDDNSSGFTFLKSLRLFADGYTAFSVVPLRFASIVGFVTATMGGLYLLYTIVFYFVSKEPVTAGYSSLLACLLFIGGMLMMMIGLVGEYIGRIYICINQSPQYVVRKTYNIEGVETVI